MKARSLSKDALVTPEKFQQIRRAFDSLLALVPEARESALRQMEQNDPRLADEVRQLYEAHESPITLPEQHAIHLGSFIATQASGTQPTQMQLGIYQLLELIGEGGMGEVWLAEQKIPVRRRVAVKLIKAGMDTREVIARFESERKRWP